MEGKLRRRTTGEAANPFVDPGACRTYAAKALEGLEKRIAEER
jgi:hypothetical protein